MLNELWKPISLCPQYMVSNLGNVERLPHTITRSDGRVYHYDSKRIKPCNDSAGYPTVSLKGKTYRIHRLVALEFISNPNNYPYVDHVDHDKCNNIQSNLRWATNQQNQINARLDSPTKTSTHRGISYDSQRDKWAMGIRLRFDTEDEAIDCYNTMMASWFTSSFPLSK